MIPGGVDGRAVDGIRPKRPIRSRFGGGLGTVCRPGSARRFHVATAIVLNRIRLPAVVGGNEVANPFMVTEVNVRKDGKWLLAQLSFTRLLVN